ncbi:MAG: hypothetical protein QNK14_01285, partial [Desulfobacterales bacterium]|nr:hypothetical protein [Desulfobacterales bacterium]
MPASRSGFNTLTISSKASSQDILFHLPSPRSPTRFIGYRIRSGKYTSLGPDCPLEHINPCVLI